MPENNYRAFLKSRVKGGLRPGLILDREGKVLGRHQGAAYYTIGQREGLGVALGYPAYVVKINPRAGRIFLGPREEAMAREFLLKSPRFAGLPCRQAGKDFKKKVAVQVKIRYNHKPAAAKLLAHKDKIKVIFKRPQFAVTPGQAAVFYDRNIVLGGGIIDEVLK